MRFHSQPCHARSPPKYPPQSTCLSLQRLFAPGGRARQQHHAASSALFWGNTPSEESPSSTAAFPDGAVCCKEESEATLLSCHLVVCVYDSYRLLIADEGSKKMARPPHFVSDVIRDGVVRCLGRPTELWANGSLEDPAARALSMHRCTESVDLSVRHS